MLFGSRCHSTFCNYHVEFSRDEASDSRRLLILMHLDFGIIVLRIAGILNSRVDGDDYDETRAWITRRKR